MAKHTSVEAVKAELLNSGRQVVDFIVETYPQYVPVLLMTGELEKIAQQRQTEATEMMVCLETEYAKTHQSEDFLTRVRLLNEGRAIAQETVNREILFNRIWEPVSVTVFGHEIDFEPVLIEAFEQTVPDSFAGSAESYLATNLREPDLKKVFREHSEEEIRDIIIDAATKDIALHKGEL